MDKAHAESKGFKEIQTLHPNWQPDFESSYNFPADARRTVVAKCIIENGKVKRVSLLPTYVNRQSQPEILKANDPRFAEVTSYLEEITVQAGLNGVFKRDDNELVIA
jgi:poly-gamma-glutamate synthesis protein (capsule biosynthesis protein)